VGEIGAYYPYAFLEGGVATPAVEKAVRILNAVSKSPRPVGLAELCRTVEIPKSSTLAVCTTLVGLRMLRRRMDGTYELGPHLAELGRAYSMQTDLPRVFYAAVDNLALLPRETIALSVRDETDVVYIGQRRGDRALGVSYELGMTLPASCTAAGKAMLSGLTDDELDDLYDGRELPSLTLSSIAELDQLKVSLRNVRATGVAVGLEETAVGMICIGVPVYDHSRKPVAALSVSLVAAEATKSDISHISTELSNLADAMSAELGAPSHENALV